MKPLERQGGGGFRRRRGGSRAKWFHAICAAEVRSRPEPEMPFCISFNIDNRVGCYSKQDLDESLQSTTHLLLSVDAKGWYPRWEWCGKFPSQGLTHPKSKPGCTGWTRCMRTRGMSQFTLRCSARKPLQAVACFLLPFAFKRWFPLFTHAPLTHHCNISGFFPETL